MRVEIRTPPIHEGCGMDFFLVGMSCWVRIEALTAGRTRPIHPNPSRTTRIRHPAGVPRTPTHEGTRPFSFSTVQASYSPSPWRTSGERPAQHSAQCPKPLTIDGETPRQPWATAVGTRLLNCNFFYPFTQTHERRAAGAACSDLRAAVPKTLAWDRREAKRMYGWKQHSIQSSKNQLVVVI
jgi:hypothetical protein